MTSSPAIFLRFNSRKERTSHEWLKRKRLDVTGHDNIVGFNDLFAVNADKKEETLLLMVSKTDPRGASVTRTR